MASNTTVKKKVLLASAFTDSPSEISRITGVPISTVCKYLKNNSDTVKEYRDMCDQVDTLQIKDAIEEISDNTGGENIMQNNYGFVKLCYGVVGSYKDTSKMTVDEVVEEFLRHEGVRSAEEYYGKLKNNTYGKLKQDILTKQKVRGIIESGARNMPNGLRTPASHVLTAEEIEFVKQEIRAIGADESVFVFNKGSQTSYLDNNDIILICGDVLPDPYSIHPRDQMSARAVLAHEYYGHRAHRNTKLIDGSWNDEFRASYMAAKNAPNLSDLDRRLLILDAIERAKTAGVRINLNNFMRRIVYGE